MFIALNGKLWNTVSFSVANILGNNFWVYLVANNILCLIHIHIFINIINDALNVLGPNVDLLCIIFRFIRFIDDSMRCALKMCSTELAPVLLSSGTLFITGPFCAASVKYRNEIFNSLTLLKILFL